MNKYVMSMGKSGKHKKTNKKRIKVTIILVIIIFAFTLLLLSIFQKHGEEEIETPTIDDEEIVYDEHGGDELVTVNVNTEDYPDKISGYTVIGKIEIEKIGVESYIFGQSSKGALKKGAAKFWGPNINEAGNFCISGHNYKNLFGKLRTDIEVGDTFSLIRKEDGLKIDYEIFDIIDKVNPYDMQYIEQEDDGIRKATLITCDPGGLTRVIVRAQEKES